MNISLTISRKHGMINTIGGYSIEVSASFDFFTQALFTQQFYVESSFVCKHWLTDVKRNMKRKTGDTS